MIIKTTFTVGFYVPKDFEKQKWFIEHTPDIDKYKKTETSSVVWYTKNEQFYEESENGDEQIH